ncbi:MAG: EVE domain-containing protein [Aquificaceae bacterium]
MEQKGYMILKTEPSEYSFEDLLKEGVTRWDGVKNPLAQKHIKSSKKGDVCFIYHTGKEKAIVGVAKVESEPYLFEGLWVFNISPEGRLKRNITLKELKTREEFKDSLLLRMPRLSVVPLTEEQSNLIFSLGY